MKKRVRKKEKKEDKEEEKAELLQREREGGKSQQVCVIGVTEYTPSPRSPLSDQIGLICVVTRT